MTPNLASFHLHLDMRFRVQGLRGGLGFRVFVEGGGKLGGIDIGIYGNMG